MLAQRVPGTKIVTYTYDPVGNRATMIDPSGTSTYTYDAANMIKTLTNANSEVTTWSYDDAGRLTRQDMANLTKATYTYDNADRLTGLTNSKSDDTVISSFAYTYYDAGGKKTVTESGGAITTYTYDEADRLTREERTVANPYDYQYTYDYVGNRLTMVDGGTSTTTYSYSADNRLNAKVDPTLHTTRYSYDNNGNLTLANAFGSITRYTWDYDNHMLTATLPGSVITTFTYDGDGLRRQSQTTTTTTKFILDGQDVLLETDNGGVTQVIYTQTPDMYGNTISQRRGTTSAFYHYDALGSTSELTDASQNVTDTNRYYAFGANLTSPGPTANPYGYVGKQGYYTEPDLDLQYLRARWYDPSLGMFMSKDPIGLPQNYVYVADNPTNGEDPNGLWQMSGKASCFDYIPQVFCNAHPENPACPYWKEGLNAAWTSVYYDWDFTRKVGGKCCKCRYKRAKSEGWNVPQVACGSVLTVTAPSLASPWQQCSVSERVKKIIQVLVTSLLTIIFVMARSIHASELLTVSS